MGGSLTFERFEPREFIVKGDRVIVLGWESGTATATGKRFENPWATAFRVEGGRIAAFDLYEDTGSMLQALSS